MSQVNEYKHGAADCPDCASQQRLMLRTDPFTGEPDRGYIRRAADLAKADAAEQADSADGHDGDDDIRPPPEPATTVTGPSHSHDHKVPPRYQGSS
jgi:hypothetical protein